MNSYKVNIITPDNNEYFLKVDANEYILDCALASGLDLPYSCLQGWCLTCAAKVIEGKINQKESKRFFESDRQNGFALLCTGKPESDLILETNKSEEMKEYRSKHKLPFPKGSWGIKQ